MEKLRIRKRDEVLGKTVDAVIRALIVKGWLNLEHFEKATSDVKENFVKDGYLRVK